VVKIEGGSERVREIYTTFNVQHSGSDKGAAKQSFLERLGQGVYKAYSHSVRRFFFLVSDVFYWTVSDLFRAKTFRKGEFVNQSVLIGSSAVAIVTLLSFLIGGVIALQSSAQLRQFGANRFIVDLTVVSMFREMGPLLTAIVVAGRSGSAIASEIATMQITEELDSLRTMALDPVRFIVVPKLYAAVFTMPFLTILANVVGTAGGLGIAVYYLDITPMAFINRMQDVLLFRDVLTGLIKSLVFAGIIVLTGSFYGFRADKGATEVGRVTTSAVVVSIALVIFADSMLGLVFY
jgi:phospholipid/cholesterol/gamma-HCH transport system permease protein